MHSGSTVSGNEMKIKHFAPYIYCGRTFVGGDIALDANGKSLIGYGYTGSANSQNGAVQEITGGWSHAICRDPKYGGLQEFGGHAYFFRNSLVAPGSPKNAHEDAAFFDLRYVLPGTAPTVEY
ncbi:MAG TPA: hypothetical protein VIY49_02685 [Bryobacteraceae bacterium]